MTTVAAFATSFVYELSDFLWSDFNRQPFRSLTVNRQTLCCLTILLAQRGKQGERRPIQSHCVKPYIYRHGASLAAGTFTRTVHPGNITGLSFIRMFFWYDSGRLFFI
jgi:hypothetical protein